MAGQGNSKHKSSGKTEGNRGKDALSPPGEKNLGPQQTRMPDEQDPKRRLGNFVGDGEAPLRKP
jgi:hypothetical protein